MRILTVTAFYPPFEIGGWGQLTRDLNLLLEARGHQTLTLVSNHRADEPHESRANVKRVLLPESGLNHYRPIKDFVAQSTRWKQNEKTIRHTVDEFEPDVIFIHGMWGLSKRIPWLFEQLCPNRVVYYLANDWPYMPNAHQRYWQDVGQRPLLKQVKKAASRPLLNQIKRTEAAHPLSFDNVLCVSQWTLENLANNTSVPRENLHVVHNGITPERFAPNGRTSRSNTHFELLYAGALVEHKGVHTAIEAMACLKESNIANVRLTVMGRGHPDYEARLKAMVAAHELDSIVLFRDWVAREAMPSVMQQYHALVLCTITPEPLSRVMQEAMSAELAVIGTLTGGTGELLVDEQTGLTFPAGNAAALAASIQKLSQNPRLRAKLAAEGRQSVLSNFTMQRMVEQVEYHLTRHIEAAMVGAPS